MRKEQSNKVAISNLFVAKSETIKTERSKLKSFLISEIKELYWAEKQLLKSLARMKSSAATRYVKDEIDDHLSIKEDHIDRLEQIFFIHKEKVEAIKCDAMEGILKEVETIIGKTQEYSLTRDAGIIMIAQKIIHYEIATYSSLMQFANTLGKFKTASILGRTLNEEKETSEFLKALSDDCINQSALLETESELEDAE